MTGHIQNIKLVVVVFIDWLHADINLTYFELF